MNNYNKLCKDCEHECKQRACDTIISCLKVKRFKKEAKKHGRKS